MVPRGLCRSWPFSSQQRHEAPPVIVQRNCFISHRQLLTVHRLVFLRTVTNCMLRNCIWRSTDQNVAVTTAHFDVPRDYTRVDMPCVNSLVTRRKTRDDSIMSRHYCICSCVHPERLLQRYNMFRSVDSVTQAEAGGGLTS